MSVTILSSSVQVGRPDAQGDTPIESVVEVRNDTAYTYEGLVLTVRLRSGTGAMLSIDCSGEGALRPGEHTVIRDLTHARLEGGEVHGCTAQLDARRTERASAPCAHLVHPDARYDPAAPVHPAPPTEGLTLDLASLDAAFAQSRTAVWDSATCFVGAMRLHAYTHPAGDALVLQALLTGRGDSSLRLEVWGYGPAFGPGQVHEVAPLERVAEEELVHVGDDGTVRYHPTEVVVDGAGQVLERHEQALTHHSVRIDGEYVQVALDLEGALRRHLDPAAGMAVLLGRDLHRYEVFLDEERLRAHVGLPDDAAHLFALDEWLHPDALQPASSSADLMAVLAALAQRAPRPALPVAASHAWHLARRFEVLAAWGFPSGWG